MHRFLELMESGSFLVTEVDKANIDVLVTMLGELDKQLVCATYGLFGVAKASTEALAQKHGVSPEVVHEIIEKDLRKITITPEWQMMVQQLQPLVKKRIGLV